LTGQIEKFLKKYFSIERTFDVFAVLVDAPADAHLSQALDGFPVTYYGSGTKTEKKVPNSKIEELNSKLKEMNSKNEELELKLLEKSKDHALAESM
jgi:hypothetical protein